MAKATILVVEDERLVARGIRDNLEHLGYSLVEPAFSGEEAIARVRGQQPDLILMDIFLGGNMDGIEAAKRIKEMADLPIVYLTAYADQQTLERAKVTEPYGYILKPYEERELQSTIEMALYKNRSEKRLHHLNELLESIRKIQTIIFREKDPQRLLHHVCQLLLEMRGHIRVWIALVDAGGRVTAGAAAGQDQATADVQSLLQQGDLPECGRRYLEERGRLDRSGRNTAVSCAECTCPQEGKGLSAVLVELAHYERLYGILGVCLKADLAADAREMSLLQEMADDIALALANLELAEQARTYQAALAASEAKYRLVFDHAPLGLMHYDQDGAIIAVNDAFVAIIGSSREKLLGFQMLRQLQDDQMRQAVKNSLAGGTGYYEGEYLSVTGGKKTLIRAFFRNIYNEKGDFGGGVCISEDYTEKFKAEQEKQDSLNFLQILMDAMPNPVFYKDVSGRYLGINKAAGQAWDRPREEIIGKTVFDLHPPDLAATYQVRDQVLFQHPGIQIYETQVVNPDGSRRDVMLHKAAFFHADGSLGGLIGVEADITERKRMEEALRESEHRLSLAQRIAHIGDWEWEVKTNKTFWSDEVFRIFGLEPGDRQPSYELAREHTHPDDLELWQQAVKAALIESDWFTLDYRGLRADGSLVWIHNEAKVIRDEAGRAVKMVGTAQDITERKHAEVVLRESEARYRALMETAADAIVLVDAETGSILEVNDKTAVLLGRPRSEIIGRHYTFLHPQADEDYYRQIFESHVHRGCGTVGQIMYAQHQDGHRIPVEISASLCELEGRKVIWGIFRDLTERLQAAAEKDRLEAQLFQTQKMEAIGTLAGGIAHDFNNMLWAILGYTEMTLLGLPANCQERFNLEQVMQAGQRARDLVEQILAFSRKSVKEKKPLRLGLIVQEVLKLLRATLPATIIFRHHIAAPDTLVLADATQLHQVVLNLCTNAAHAMQDTGGTLRLGLEEYSVDDTNQVLPPGLTPGPYLVLTVQDTGHGIEPDNLPRLFEPFFTTKGVGQGSGMGLSVVHGIVKSLGGEILVTSQVGVGSTFSVFLPIFTGEEQLSSIECLPFATGTNRILCIDDEPMLGDLLKAELGKLGYEVTVMTSSVEALEIFRSHPEHFDLVITDQTMPYLTGMQLAREFKELRPDIPIIICTGYSDKVSETTIKEAGIKEMLMKPVDLGQLAEVVRRVLDEKN